MLNKAITIILFAIIVFTILAHGTVEVWSLAIFHILGMLLLLIWGIKKYLETESKFFFPLSFVPLGLYLLLGITQFVIGFSFEPDMTRTVVVSFVFLLIIYIVSANHLITNADFKFFANFLTIFGFVLAIFAILQYFSWNGHLYWIRETNMSMTRVSGPFVNSNHFAGVMELIIPMPLALVLSEVQKKTRVIYGFAAIVMIVAAVASLSRGGIISLAIGLFFLVAVWIIYSNRNNNEVNSRLQFFRKVGLAVGLLVLVVVGTYWVAGDPVTERVTNNNILGSSEKTSNFYRSRGWIWENSWRVFKENSIIGTGMGTHGTVFPIYSSGDGRNTGGRPILFDRVHNDYIQILADTGIIGGIIILAFLISLGYYFVKIFSITDELRAIIGIASSASILMLLIHSLFDFNLQIISNALLFLVIVGILGNAVTIKERSLI